jgi:hypothetical protein
MTDSRNTSSRSWEVVAKIILFAIELRMMGPEALAPAKTWARWEAKVQRRSREFIDLIPSLQSDQEDGMG